MEPAVSAVEGSAARCLRSGRVCGARDPLFPFWSAAAGSGPWVPGEKRDAAFPPLRCHPERSALFALRTCLRSEGSAVSLLECGGGLRAIGARRETRRRFPASTMSSRAQRGICFWCHGACRDPVYPERFLRRVGAPLRLV